MRAYERLRSTAIAIMERFDAFGVELDDRGVHVMASPAARHELAISRLLRQLLPQAGADMVAHIGTPEIDDPATGRLRRPDLVVVPEAALERPGRSYLRPEDVELVAEVVSGPTLRTTTNTKPSTIPPWEFPPMSSSTPASRR